MKLVATLLSILLLLTLGANAQQPDRYRVRVSSRMTQEAAAGLKSQLLHEGYAPVEIIPQNGTFAVVVGTTRTEKQAQDMLNDLKTAGFPVDAVEPAPAGSTAAATPASTSATPANTASKPADATPAAKLYRVQVAEFDTAEQAETVRKQLFADDYYGVNVEKEGDKYKVYRGEGLKQDDARKMADQLKQDSYSMATVVAAKERVEAVPSPEAAKASPTPAPEQPLPPELQAAVRSDDEKQSLERILDAAKRHQSHTATTEDYSVLRTEQRKLRPELRALIAKYTKDKEDQRIKGNQQVTSIYSKFSEALEQKDWNKASQLLAQVREIDPEDPYLMDKQELLQYMKKTGDNGASGAGLDKAQKIEKWLGEGKTAEDRKDYDLARLRYNQILDLDPQSAEAQKRLADLKKSPEATKASAAATAGTGGSLPFAGNKWLLGIGGAVVLLLAIVLVYLSINARRERELIRQVQELTSHGAESRAAEEQQQREAPSRRSRKEKSSVSALGSSKMFAGPLIVDAPTTITGSDDDLSGGEVEEEIVVRAEPPKKQPTLEPVHETRPPGEADVVSLSFEDDFQAPVAPVSEPPKDHAESDTVSLDGFEMPLPDIDELPPMPETVSTESLPDFDALMKQGLFTDSDTVTTPGIKTDVPDSLPFVPPGPEFDEPLPSFEYAPVEIEPVKEPTPAPEVKPAKPEPVAPVAAAPKVAPPPPAAAPEPVAPAPVPEPPAPAPAPPPVPAAPSAYLDQSFEGTDEGAQPSDWRGEYDYASLTVVTDIAPDGSSRSLKFEKRSGAGSANFVCHFPKASGRVIVEFDIRCDDKNKYLLGLYVEKDEDFKQSVHTIVHRTDSKSKPSLRIQGEPISYELGTWRHVKYDLNLMIGLINAFVDDKQVVREGKLPTTPAYVNTLSIRDNLATTGVLYLANILVYKA